MVNLYQITGVPEPAKLRDASLRDKRPVSDPSKAPVRDNMELSSDAQDAAAVAQLVNQAQSGPDIREQRVAEAKENLEKGTYQVQKTVLEVAARITAYLDI